MSNPHSETPPYPGYPPAYYTTAPLPYFPAYPSYFAPATPSGAPTAYYPATAAVQAPVAPAPPRRFPLENSVWVGDLDAYMDENYLRSAVNMMGWVDDVNRIRVVRDRGSGAHAGYGFFEAASPESARRLLATGNGVPIPGTNRCWRLNMGRPPAGSAEGAEGVAGMAPGARARGDKGDANIYVGDLLPAATEVELMSAFKEKFASVKHAKIVCDEAGRPRGYGFVRFGDPDDADRAVEELNGMEIAGQPVRLNHANRSSTSLAKTEPGESPAVPKRTRQQSGKDDPTNTTVFVGGTGPNISADILYRELGRFGEVETVKLPPNKVGFVFVRFKYRADARRAIDALAGKFVEALNPTRPVRLEWASEQLPVPPNAATASAQGHTHASPDHAATVHPVMPGAAMYAQPYLQAVYPQMAPVYGQSPPTYAPISAQYAFDPSAEAAAEDGQSSDQVGASE